MEAVRPDDISRTSVSAGRIWWAAGDRTPDPLIKSPIPPKTHPALTYCNQGEQQKSQWLFLCAFLLIVRTQNGHRRSIVISNIASIHSGHVTPALRSTCTTNILSLAHLFARPTIAWGFLAGRRLIWQWQQCCDLPLPIDQTPKQCDCVARARDRQNQRKPRSTGDVRADEIRG